MESVLFELMVSPTTACMESNFLKKVCIPFLHLFSTTITATRHYPFHNIFSIFSRPLCIIRNPPNLPYVTQYLHHEFQLHNSFGFLDQE